jgi:tetratricopeptide (TPR) repeat protein
MPESVQYYDVLGVNPDVTVPEIKRAYFSAVRKYPPERFPEEFKQIREAYEALSDPENRLIYDSGLNNPEFGNYFAEADRAYNNGIYEEAIIYLQKALAVSPGNRMARNLMGLCYLEIAEYDKAASVFKKLTYEFPDKALFFYNLGEALLGKGAYRQAMEAYETSLRLDETDIQAWKGLALCNLKQNKYLQAREALEQGIRICGADTSIYMKLIFVDVAQGNIDKLRKDITQLEALAMNEAEMRENVAWALAEIADYLMNDKPEFAAKLLEKAKKLNPAEQAIKKMHKEASKKQKLAEPLRQMKNDPAVHPWIKDIAAGAILGYENPLEEMDLDISKRLLLRDPANILTSVKHLQLQYPEIFSAGKDFFQTLIDNPNGSKVDEKKLLQDIKLLESYAGRTDTDPIILDDIYIPPLPRVKTIEVGRNDLCPCGSGKKYKKCCLLRQVVG